MVKDDLFYNFNGGTLSSMIDEYQRSMNRTMQQFVSNEKKKEQFLQKQIDSLRAESKIQLRSYLKPLSFRITQNPINRLEQGT